MKIFKRKYKINEDGRIQALKDFGDVKKGDIGGYVDGYHNLSQSGACWIYDDARVYQNAKVKRHAQVRDKCEIYQDVVLTDYFIARGKSVIYARAKCCGHAEVENVRVLGQPYIGGSTKLISRGEGKIEVFDSPKLKYNINILEEEHLIQFFGYGYDADARIIYSAPDQWLVNTDNAKAYKEVLST